MIPAPDEGSVGPCGDAACGHARRHPGTASQHGPPTRASTRTSWPASPASSRAARSSRA